MHYQLKINKLDGGLIGPEDDEYTPYAFTSMKGAREQGVAWAQQHDLPVAVERVTDGALPGREGYERGAAVPEVKCVLIIQPDGSFAPPPRARQADGIECKAGLGRPPCFCANCRAARKR